MDTAPLTPAEAFVLLDPRRSSPTEAFKIAFLSLVVLGVLKIETVKARTLFGMKDVPAVSIAREPPDLFLAAEVVKAVRQARQSRSGIHFNAIAISAVKIFGPALVKVKTELILPALEKRGQLTSYPDRVLLVFKRTLYIHTPAGLTEKQRIEAVLAEARRLPALLQSDPVEAKAVALAAGSLVLLVPELKSHYGQLAALNPASSISSDGGDFSAIGDGHSSAGGHHGSFDFGSFDLGSFDVGALDMDFGSFDSSFSDSGGDGGDGGGGHH